ncbi:hypothetical protein EBU24_06310 [bacterium]|nr:hypothetical protein [bacterium]
MSKLASALGKKYEENRLSVLTRHFELGGHTFKVRVPAVNEIEAIYNYFKSPDDEKVEAIYQDMIKDFKDDKDDGIEVTDNDILIEGRSMREAARNKHVLQYRITEYIKFLVPETGSLEDLTYADVEIEFPLAIQLTLVEKINEVIAPDYKEIRSK